MRVSGAVTIPLKLFADRIVFPFSRWHRSNLYLWQRKIKGSPLETPSVNWMIFGRIYFYLERLVILITKYYYDTVIQKYSIFIKKHYFENYAFSDVSIGNKKHMDSFRVDCGSIKQIFENNCLLKIVDFKSNDSFLDCGCGPGGNIQGIKRYMPNAEIIGFDLSPNAVKFAGEYFKGQKVEVFQGSVLDMGVFKKYLNNSIENILFAYMFSTIYSGNIEETRRVRQEIIDQAVRIARKNVIIFDYMEFAVFIEQKYRAIFQEDYSVYFEKHKDIGDVVFGENVLIFHKKN